MMKWRLSVLAGVLMASGEGAAQSSSERDGLSPFTEEAIARGLIYETRPISPFEPATHGHGIAVADINGNGHQDIILLGHPTGKVGFFENDGTGHFIDRSYADIDGTPTPKFIVPYASGIAVADYTGNGLKDVYITQVNVNNGPNVLLRNDGDFHFTDISAAAGVDNIGRGHAALWADFDNDGWLDLYVVNYTLPSQVDDPTYRNKLYRNNGDGTFEDVSEGSGVDDFGMGLAAAFSDMNRNGWLDLYLANDKGTSPPLHHGNQSWRNVNGQFENTCKTSGLCLQFWAMCVAAGDVTGNGYPDFYVTNLPHPAGYNGWNPLFINHGDETFSEQCTEAGVCQLIFSWAAIFFDFNNSGWLDLYVVNQTEDNRLYANAGDFPLDDVTTETEVGGSPGHSYNAAVGDLTGSGALDIVLNDSGSDEQPRNVQLFINHEGDERNWVRFNVVGDPPNHHAIGSNIEITANGHTQWRELYAGGNNFKAQNELVYHFGLSDAEVIDQITVRWPGGRVSRTLTNYPANETWTIHPPDALGDANGDGVIDGQDLLAMLSAWGPVQPGNELMDINGDGVIDGQDLLMLLSMWGSNTMTTRNSD